MLDSILPMHGSEQSRRSGQSLCTEIEVYSLCFPLLRGTPTLQSLHLPQTLPSVPLWQKVCRFPVRVLSALLSAAAVCPHSKSHKNWQINLTFSSHNVSPFSIHLLCSISSAFESLSILSVVYSCYLWEGQLVEVYSARPEMEMNLNF